MDIKDEHVDGLRSEMIAGKRITKHPENQVWNDAHDRCISLLEEYRLGKGLFQIDSTTPQGT